MACVLLGAAVVALPKSGSAAEPARQWVVYLLPHSHVDIGYTHVQTEVERKHWSYYEQAIEAARRTADYPSDARFKWNVEVLWAVDSYLRQASPEKQREFIEAVKHGSIELDALYGNELTGLCRPEELLRLCDYARQISRRCGVKIDSGHDHRRAGLHVGTDRRARRRRSEVSLDGTERQGPHWVYHGGLGR